MARELTEMQSKFIDVLFEEIDKGVPMDKAKEIANSAAGYTGHPSKAFRPLQDEIINRAKEELAMELPTVVKKVKGVLNDPEALGNKYVLDASTWIADRVGLTKIDQSTLTLKTDQGVVIIPPKKTE